MLGQFWQIHRIHLIHHSRHGIRTMLYLADAEMALFCFAVYQTAMVEFGHCWIVRPVLRGSADASSSPEQKTVPSVIYCPRSPLDACVVKCELLR